jgi:hypothetical protein
MMTTLNLLGAASFAFVAWFTYRAYTREPGPGQSPRSAIIEAWMNIGVGFSINFGANFILLPLVGAHFTPGQNFALGWIYTAVSIVRQYVIRRWFNARLHAAAVKLAGGIGG